jgi:toxin-antitoxin system PIN domain toxin
MTYFFPDVNVWLALSVNGHSHGPEAWRWFSSLRDRDQIVFTRFTQLALLRLLTNTSAMGERLMSLGEAWNTYDEWLLDPRVQFHPEPYGLDRTFREVTAPFSKQPVSKVVGDSYLLAFARQSGASLVTFDQALSKQARKVACASVIPS